MKKIDAFTLLELLIVVGIIGIIMVALLPAVKNVPARARDAQARAALNDIATALASYRLDKGKYPDQIPGNNTSTTSGCLLADMVQTPNSPDLVELADKYMGGVLPLPPTGVGNCLGKYYYYRSYLGTYTLGAYLEFPDGNIPVQTVTGQCWIGSKYRLVTHITACATPYLQALKQGFREVADRTAVPSHFYVILGE